jgi:gas vesicle protein
MRRKGNVLRDYSNLSIKQLEEKRKQLVNDVSAYDVKQKSTKILMNSLK